MAVHEFEYLIIGGGILGTASAYSLSKELKKNGSAVSIAVIDLDLEGEFSSTLKNAGGVRATWRNDANIQLCKFSIDFFETISDYIDFKQFGYYWLHSDTTWEEININHKKYLDYGLDVELYEKDKINKHLPFVDNLDGVSGLSVSRKAGLIDHYSLREYLRKAAREAGVKFYDRQFVTGMDIKGNSVGVVITRDISLLIKQRGPDEVRKILKGMIPDGEENVFKCEVMINSAGAWAGSISRHYGFTDDEIKPRRRQIELVKCPDLDISGYGMIIDTSDIYFHKEGDMILVGYSNKDEPYGVNFRFDFYGLEEKSPFIDLIWKPLWNRISSFERLKFIRGWAGIYAETPDRSGYLGKVTGLDNIFECAGHTGRGLMISYGVGEAIADLILKGKFREELSFAADFERSRPNGQLYEQLHL